MGATAMEGRALERFVPTGVMAVASDFRPGDVDYSDTCDHPRSKKNQFAFRAGSRIL